MHRNQVAVAEGAAAWRRFLRVGGLGALCYVAALAAADQTPEQQIDALYGADFKKVKASPATQDDLALAQKLIEVGLSAKQNKPFQAGLFRRAEALALEDATSAGAQAAEQAATGLIAAQIAPAASGWQELTDRAQPVLRRRNQGRADPLLEPYLGWLKKQADAALAAGDTQATERSLNALVREAQYHRCKYEADQAQLMLAQCRFEAPMRAAVKREWAKWEAQPEDAELRQKAGETVLAQLGDWAAAQETLGRLEKTDWPFLLAQRQARLQPPLKPKDGEAHAGEKPAAAAPVAATSTPAGAVSAQRLLAAADLLNALAAPNRSSAPGRAAVLTEAAALYEAAQQADAAGLSTQQKIELATLNKQAQAAADKARTEAQAALARAARLSWIPLISANRAADWSDIGQPVKWEMLEDEVLQGKGTWEGMAGSLRATKQCDFILEGDFQRRDAEARPVILLRAHNGPPCYVLYFSEDHATLSFAKGDGEGEEREVQKRDVAVGLNQWRRLQVVAEGDRFRVWIDGRLIVDARDQGELGPGGVGLGAAGGTAWFRNLRLRELP